MKRDIMPEMIIKLRNQGNLRKNVRQVTKMTGKNTCQMEMILMTLRKHV
jgi:hypothetical protein